jgi:peptide subunit release factor RF-3
MNNFGIELFLKTFITLASSPQGREATISFLDSTLNKKHQQLQQQQQQQQQLLLDDYDGSTLRAAADSGFSPLATIETTSDHFSAFVFKLQANLDPKHHDRMAFIRICSGIFRKGMKVSHSRMKKEINLSSAQSIFAQDRESITEAYPGDVIGIHNPGYFAIGDTIYCGNQYRIVYPSIPSFSPEKFAYLENPNPSLYKKFQKVKVSVLFFLLFVL